MKIMTTNEILIAAKNAKKDVKRLTNKEKNNAISVMADSLLQNADYILCENEKDINDAKGQISDVMIDRLSLSKERITAMANGMREVMSLPDPNGKILNTVKRPNGLVIEKTAVPMGVIGIIYESRPNVTSDAAALCFKSSNVCVLRGGKEAYRTSKAIVNVLREGLKSCNINENAINLIDDTTRQSANEMMTAKGKIDLLIPRGGKGLISACVKNATVPCIETGTGICHIYVEKTADTETALNIIDNAKTSRPSVCNACEVTVIDEKIADSFLPRLYERLTVNREHPVKFVVDEKAAKIIDGVPAGDDGLDRESAAVYVNASTRFTDGGEFGLGCEMGISTQKTHARGPMGLSELMTYHYVIKGNGQVR